MKTLGEFGIKVLLLSVALSFLPSSPFVGFGNLVSSIPYLSYLNWFIPISEMIAVFEAWLVVVGVYYGILYLLNYVGVFKS